MPIRLQLDKGFCIQMALDVVTVKGLQGRHYGEWMSTLSGAWLRSTECIVFTSLFIAARFAMSRGYWSRMLGHFRLWPPSWTDWHTWLRSHAGIDPMPNTMNLNHLKLLYCEFHKYEVMTMSVVGGQPKKKSKYQLKSIKITSNANS